MMNDYVIQELQRAGTLCLLPTLKFTQHIVCLCDSEQIKRAKDLNKKLAVTSHHSASWAKENRKVYGLIESTLELEFKNNIFAFSYAKKKKIYTNG